MRIAALVKTTNILVMIHQIVLILNVLLAACATETKWIDQINKQKFEDKQVLMNPHYFANSSLNIKQRVEKKIVETMKIKDENDIEDEPTKETFKHNIPAQEDTIKIKSEKPPKFGPEPLPYRQPRVSGGPNFRGTGPVEKEHHAPITCDDFGRRATFNPFSVLDSHWFAFYYWADDSAPLLVEFVIPPAKQAGFIREVMDPLVEQPIDWKARHVLLNDMIYNSTALLVERSGDYQGRYWVYPFVKNFPTLITPNEMQFKQSSDNKYLALMVCDEQRVYILSRRRDIPSLKKLPDVIARMGYHARNGRSYLYQGHQWMPIPEMDEYEYWAPERYRPKGMYDPQQELREINGMA